ncbi:Motile sperm domain-containing protein 2 [Dermatophagoides farinae]|uniref:Motile sperm domain-containing protein 2 n=1 Tax=Dermatophagoides farinae TaxID=6954 RepID=A0A922HTT6_DERFA|nr:Motile sperm domain-containing protein 2 [Dermatophagoides farinae]
MKCFKLQYKFFQSYRHIHMTQIFDQGFIYWKQYSYRLQFSLDDYRYQKISYTYQTFKRSIWICINAWLAIFYLSIMTLYPDNPFMISRIDLERIMDTQHMDIFYIQGIITFVMLEILWALSLNNLLHYRLSSIDFLANKSNFNEKKQLRPKSRQYLYHMYLMSKLMATILYSIVTIELLIVIIMYAYHGYNLYQSFRIDIIQLTVGVSMFIIWIMHTIQMMGQLFMSLNFLLFLIEFFKVCIGQLYEMLRRFDQKCPFEKIMENDWNRFQYEYSCLYSDTAQMNRAARLILLYLEAISKSSIISACIFYSKQSGWSIFTTFVIMAFLSVFCLINGLYSRIADLSSYNQKCARLILQRIARTQWSLMNVDEKDVQIQKRYSNRYLIKLSLFAQTMTNNRYGFTCGQVFYITKFQNFLSYQPYRQMSISQIFDHGFEYLKKYTFRLEFSLQDYRYREIRFTYRTFKQRMDILSIQLIIAFSILEFLWAKMLHKILQYRLSSIDFLVSKSFFDEQKELLPKSRQYLCHMYMITHSIVTILYSIVTIELLLVIIIYAYHCYNLYQSFRIDIIEMIIRVSMFIIWVMHVIQIMVFLIEFFKVRIEQFYKILQQYDQIKPFEKFQRNDLKQFQHDYLCLYKETAQMNRTVSVLLFYLEAISKSSIISACIFYSKQSSWSVFTRFIIIAILSTFCLTNGLYSRISNLPSYNQKCARLILQRIARTQWSMVVDSKGVRPQKLFIYRYSIKSSLFVQTMTNNQFGFTCGRVFFITKFQLTSGNISKTGLNSLTPVHYQQQKPNKKPSFFFGSLNTSSNVKTGNYKKKKRKPVCTCHLAYGNLMTASSSNDLPTTGASYQYQHPPMNLYGSQPIIDPNNHGSSMIPSNCSSLIPQHHPHQQQQQQHHYSSSTTCLFPNSHHQFYDLPPPPQPSSSSSSKPRVSFGPSFMYQMDQQQQQPHPLLFDPMYEYEQQQQQQKKQRQRNKSSKLTTELLPLDTQLPLQMMGDSALILNLIILF